MIVCISINLKALKFALSRSKAKKYFSNIITNLHDMIAVYTCIYMIKISEIYESHVLASRHCWMVQCWWHYVAVYWLSMRIKILVLCQLHTTPFFINPFDVNLNLSRIIKEILFAIKTKKLSQRTYYPCCNLSLAFILTLKG